MNHVCRLVWNHVACTWQAVAESAKGFGKGRQGGRGAQSPQPASPGFSIKPLLAALSLISAAAWAGPQGGQVVAGSIAQIASVVQYTGTLNELQGTVFAVADIGRANTANFQEI